MTRGTLLCDAVIQWQTATNDAQRSEVTVTYLIITRCDDYPVTDTGTSIVSATRHPSKPMEYSSIRERLEQLYPGRTIASPLDWMPNGIVHLVYLSPNRNGEVRTIDKFQLWAVGPETTKER